MRKEPHNKFFSFSDGEKITYETRPIPRYKIYIFFQQIIGFLFFGFIFSFMGMGFLMSSLFDPFFILVPAAIFVIIIIFAWIAADLRYKKRYYWVTNNRIIFKKGFIGYSINSIPLERISDVMISRSFMERIFGFGSVHIQSMAGQVSTRGRYGSEASLVAIPYPEETQKLIFNLVKRKRKREHITM